MASAPSQRPRPAGQRALRGATALAIDFTNHHTAGLDPDDQAWSATVGMLLGDQTFHAAVLVFARGLRARALLGRQAAARGARQSRQRGTPVALRNSTGGCWERSSCRECRACSADNGAAPQDWYFNTLSSPSVVRSSITPPN